MSMGGLLGNLLRTRNFNFNFNFKFRTLSSKTKTSSSSSLELKNELITKRHQFLRLIDGETGKLMEPRLSNEIFTLKPDNYDLIMVDSRQEPPIVRFQSQSLAFKLVQQREEAATRSRLANKMKEMHVTTVTGEHDFNVKLGRVEDWIRKGWRVKIVIEEKKRKGSGSGSGSGSGLMQPVDAKKEMMNQIVGKLAGIAEIVTTPELERGCLIFSLHGTQKIISKLKQERSKDK